MENFSFIQVSLNKIPLFLFIKHLFNFSNIPQFALVLLLNKLSNSKISKIHYRRRISFFFECFEAINIFRIAAIVANVLGMAVRETMNWS